MAAALTTITNVSNQLVPILVDDIDLSDANSASDIAAAVAEQMSIQPGAQLVIETRRVDLGQLEQLRSKRLISYT